MAHILIVCTANICRSPVGAVLLAKKLEQRGLADWTVSSAGTWAQVKRGAARFSIQLMQEKGLDITTHRAQMIERTHIETADLILCMELGHMEALRAEFPDQAHKIYLLSNMVNRDYSISDPYGGPLTSYQTMVREVERLLDDGLDRIIDLASGGTPQ